MSVTDTRRSRKTRMMLSVVGLLAWGSSSYGFAWLCHTQGRNPSGWVVSILVGICGGACSLVLATGVVAVISYWVHTWWKWVTA